MINDVFTSESVSEGHPDKIADQISDAILDAVLDQDQNAKVACEVLIKNNNIIIAGEITTTAKVNYKEIAIRTIKEIGYTESNTNLDADNYVVQNLISEQSPDINRGIAQSNPEQQGAGDQGLMFGYACDETDVLMPAPIIYAHQLMQRQAKIRKQKVLDWLQPDAKCQLSFDYRNGSIQQLTAIVLSTQHQEGISQATICEAVREEIIKHVIPAQWLTSETKYFINPTGKFVIGGADGDCGLTGRKIIVDTYGGIARHGGGAFSGKDPSKVDRSAAYACRYVAKNIVAAKLAKKCEIQISYAIGEAKPMSININTFGTSTITETEILNRVLANFNFTPYEIIKNLKLKEVKYLPTACYGHFGRENEGFTWEKLDLAEKLK